MTRQLHDTGDEYYQHELDGETFDYYVDGNLEQSGVPFLNSASQIDEAEAFHRTFSNGLSYHEDLNTE